MRLSIEAVPIEGDPEGAQVFVYLDQEGLGRLVEILGNLRKTDHVHLFSEEWGGWELSNERQNADGLIVRHAKICLEAEGAK